MQKYPHGVAATGHARRSDVGRVRVLTFHRIPPCRTLRSTICDGGVVASRDRKVLASSPRLAAFKSESQSRPNSVQSPQRYPVVCDSSQSRGNHGLYLSTERRASTRWKCGAVTRVGARAVHAGCESGSEFESDPESEVPQATKFAELGRHATTECAVSGACSASPFKRGEHAAGQIAGGVVEPVHLWARENHSPLWSNQQSGLVWRLPHSLDRGTVSALFAVSLRVLVTLAWSSHCKSGSGPQ